MSRYLVGAHRPWQIKAPAANEASPMNDRRCIPGYNQHSIRSAAEDSVVDLARRRSD
jgi:hypothetical protein